MDYGATFKKLRLEKGITLKEACQQGISSAQLSRFENGKSMLTVDQFFYMLAKYQVTIEEFQFVGKQTLKTVLKSLSSRCRSILIRIKKRRLVRWHNVFC